MTIAVQSCLSRSMLCEHKYATENRHVFHEHDQLRLAAKVHVVQQCGQPPRQPMLC